jgi:hypothetical protein
LPAGNDNNFSSGKIPEFLLCEIFSPEIFAPGKYFAGKITEWPGLCRQETG